MRTSTGSPDSLAAVLTTTTRPHSPKRDGYSNYSAVALLNFFFHRVTRSGPKLLLYLALLLASSLLITKCLPTGVSDSIVSSTSHLWTFRPGGSNNAPVVQPGDNNDHDSFAGGGLRIVVFGENDIATSMLQNVPGDVQLGTNNGTSWTRELCIELGCTTYLSQVPSLDSPRRSLSSNPLYGGATDDVLRDSKGQTPANDYSYVSSAHPITWEAPDLYTQVARFLEKPAPKRAPKETIWVFSFGMWDVWSLAAFPYGKAESILAAMVSDIFSNVESLYDAAHDAKSIAYSDYSMTPLSEVNGNQAKTDAVSLRAREAPPLPWDEASSEPFRVMIPLLFDPSLVPGWHLDRPDVPAPHTKPEQVRNAVRLTKRWNDFVTSEMESWTKKNVTFVNPADRPKLTFDAGGDDSKKGAEIKKPERRDESTTKKDDTSRPTPTLYRDGIIFRLSDYLMDVIIDGQLQTRGIADRKGFGKFSNSESFLEVEKACLVPVVLGISKEFNATKAILSEMRFEGDDKKKVDGKPGASDAEASPKADAAPDATQPNSSPNESLIKRGAAAAQPLQVCDHPERYLFFTPFSLGQRAIEELGRLSAAILRANRSTRAAWERSRSGGIESDRQPGSWKEYYTS